ncbi:PA1571 family protein [Pseudomonas sp. MWU16-30317]|uniref:PA1571 family protein n=1 Tax=Pseudomonas sp. MWU16-30317 TaxID=2878095 RepID=UPI001CFB5890|nr:PA1571 family protein [Pseudomonas sp. MWU16-30317]
MSLQSQPSETLPVQRVQPHHAVGGSIIDAQGREVPITEDMVQQACRELEKRLVAPRK